MSEENIKYIRENKEWVKSIEKDLINFDFVSRMLEAMGKKSEKIRHDLYWKDITVDEAKEKIELIFIKISLRYKRLKINWLGDVSG